MTHFTLTPQLSNEVSLYDEKLCWHGRMMERIMLTWEYDARCWVNFGDGGCHTHVLFKSRRWGWPVRKQGSIPTFEESFIAFLLGYLMHFAVITWFSSKVRGLVNNIHAVCYIRTCWTEYYVIHPNFTVLFAFTLGVSVGNGSHQIKS